MFEQNSSRQMDLEIYAYQGGTLEKKYLRLSMGEKSLGGGQGRQMGCLELEFGRKS